MQEKNLKFLDSVNAPVVKLALQDALTAMKYVRQNAREYNIDPNKLGFMGSSAGGTVSNIFKITAQVLLLPVRRFGSGCLARIQGDNLLR